MEFAPERITARMEARRLAPGELASLLGVTAQQVNQWTSGRVRPSIPTLEKLSAALGVTPGYFFVKSLPHMDAED